MKKIVILISVLFLISACSGSKEISPEDIQSTISVGIEQTQLANPTSTYTNTPTNTPTYTPEPTNTPAPTNTPGPTNTPNPNAIASDFIYYFKDNFQFYAKKLNPPIDVELIKFAFEYDSESNLNLVFETKSGELLIQDGTAVNYSIVMLANDLEKGRQLPKGIKEVLFAFKNNDLETRKQYILDWEVLLDYVEEDITVDQLLAALRTP